METETNKPSLFGMIENPNNNLGEWCNSLYGCFPLRLYAVSLAQLLLFLPI
ncbi:hypothetical protein ACUXCC_000737 [Cytobacillus horneckiae]|uniref:hypothetical protein n=1 Tax=Cytobacillus horneckiae TaxID=549687 RepID=UPI000AAF575C|nr:hypothetical protein [Cytobacillus horneckiae]MBN6886081.1 hypothetical protein [Cytobacillus horneckiae]MCM3176385.1 hypothetical protein [Cytobacillus horneckiae]MEC1155781.1 hypothetical protein [Cytobacillus horneckiae]MED2939320.1 hypothetical protein [Cytobacillus horneckiae]